MCPQTMTDSSTHFCTSTRLADWLRRCLVACCFLLAQAAMAQSGTEISHFSVERTEDELQLSAQLQFELAAAVEDALAKGIPMVFVASVEVLRERWYWYDKKVAGAERYLKLAYQPLLRRWKLQVGTGPAVLGSAGLALNQTYDTLAQALSAAKRIAGWKIASVSELDPTAKYRVEFSYRLDVGQLPRPFQIGTLGQPGWDVAASLSVPLSPEILK
jgi:hypothetical protein